MARLEAKIEADRSKMGNGKTICNGILGTLPEDKQQRVSHWFISGGSDGQYDVDSFLEHIKDKFEDKEAKQTAGDQLNRMRMGDAQKFDDFLQDFEFKLSQCGGLEWADRDKIIRLNTAINAKLSDKLISVELPDDSYSKWVKRVRNVAGRLQNHPDYKNGSHTKTWYVKAGRSYVSPSSSGGRPPSKDDTATEAVDDDGDVKMVDVGTLKSIINAIKGLDGDQRRRGQGSKKPAGQDKPRAKWLSKKEMEALKEAEKCFRCQKKGHLSRNCPDFRPAKAPDVSVNMSKSKQRDSEDLEDDLESHGSESEFEQKKE
jgi:hypothetical protein